MIYTRMMAAYYGQPPDFFDDWPSVDVTRELMVFSELREQGHLPLEQWLFKAVWTKKD